MMQDLQDSSEEDEGDGNEYDTTDRFLVADDAAEDDDGEGGEEGAAKRRKKRRRRREEDEELDEEDYELIVSPLLQSTLHSVCQKLSTLPCVICPLSCPLNTHIEGCLWWTRVPQSEQLGFLACCWNSARMLCRGSGLRAGRSASASAS